MSDPSLTPKQITIQLNHAYSLSDLFTFDPGVPPAGDSFLGAVANFYADPNVIFSGTELSVGGNFYRYGITGVTDFVGQISGDFGSATITFTAPTSLSGTIQWDDSIPAYPNGYVFVDFVSYSLSFSSPLFTTHADSVNFNNLTSDQQAAIANGADTTNGLGGNDEVTLNASYRTFSTGSKPGDSPTVTGANANFSIALGAGSDVVDLTGNGASNVVGGSGNQSITITGDGDNGVTAGSGNTRINITGNGSNSVVAGTGTDTINIFGDGFTNISGTTGTYNINLGGKGDDDITINGNGKNTITGNAGSDTIQINGDGDNKITAGGGTVSVIIHGNGNNTVDASTATSANSITITGTGVEKITGGNAGNNISTGAGNDFLKGGAGSDTFAGVGLTSSAAQAGNDEINGASYTNLNSTDIVTFANSRATYDIKFKPTLSLSDGSSSVGFGAIVSPINASNKDTIINWNKLQFTDKTILESDLYHASAVAYGLWSLADAFEQLRSYIGLSNNISDPKLKAIGAWFDYVDGVIGGLAQVATESDSDFKSAIKVTLAQAANAATAPIISQAKSVLESAVDKLPMPDSWKATAKASIETGATDLTADVSLATVALVDRVAQYKNNLSSINWSAQWQQWMDDVKARIGDTYKLFDPGDPQQEWDDPHLPTPQAPTLPPSDPVIVNPLTLNIPATHGQSFSLSSLFLASNVAGHSISQYDVWDTGAGGAYMSLNGQKLASQTDNLLTPAQLVVALYQSGSGNTDTLFLRASDGSFWSSWAKVTVTFPIDNAPVATAPNITAMHGQASVAASSLFTVSDADGDTITQYALWDTNGNGHWIVNGAAQAANAEVDITAAQLAQTSYQFGSAADQLWVRAYDGILWGAWVPFTATPYANHPPMVVASDVAATHNQNIAASGLFTATDVDGDTIANYQLWDSTTDPSSGHWVVGGVSQGSNVAIDVSAAQLATTTFQSGSGSDDLWVRANDGTLWGAWKEFHVNAPIDNAPVVNASDVNAIHGQNIAAGTLFTASDADHDAITGYQFWDSTADSASGHFVVAGAAQPSNQSIDVSAAQLANASFQSGSGSDDLWVRAFDGTKWSSWKEFHVNAPLDNPPVVTAADFTATHNQNVAASALLSASDADGDTVTNYQLWDSTTDPSSGHWVVGGVAQAANVAIGVTSAQLSTTTFQSGSGADDLWARAYDGFAWGPWKEFHVNAPLDRAPVVTAPDYHAAPSQSIAASSLFSVSDPDGDSITQYQFWDSTASVSSGHWAISGTVQPVNTAINVNAAQLAATSFQSGTVSDDLWVRASDGVSWSTWQEFHVLV
ncbi:hypothetical protein [Bradyrhizobium sp. USDA 4486]